MADFSTPGDEDFEQNIVDILPGMEFLIEQWWGESGGATWLNYYAPTPRFHAEVVQNRVIGMDWPVGASVTLTIDDPDNGVGVDFTDTRTVNSTPLSWDSDFTTVNFNDLGGLTLTPDMFISMTDGNSTRTHTLTNLVVTGVDLDLDTVWGTGTPGAQIGVQYCAHNAGCNWVRSATIQPDSTWQVDFSVPGGSTPEEQNLLDIQPGMFGEALEGNADGITDYRWGVPNPRITVQPDHGWIDGYDWPVGVEITVTVDDDADLGNGWLYREMKTTVPEEWDASMGYVDFYPEIDMQPGQVITMTDGNTAKTHVIYEVHFVSVDVDTDIAEGTGPADRPANVWLRTAVGNHSLDLMIGSDGNWIADFGAAGIDIQDLQAGNIEVYDDDSDATMAHLPNPSFAVRLPENEVHGYEWPLGASVTLYIDDLSVPGWPDYTDYPDQLGWQTGIRTRPLCCSTWAALNSSRATWSR